MTTTKTLAQFIAERGISMTAERMALNLNMEDSDKMDNWLCEIRVGSRKMKVPFSMGKGHNGRRPKAEDVLDCLASDASGADQTFEAWCSDYGYDTDSRRAERTFRTCQRQSAELKALIGREAFDELVYNIERL